MDLCQKINEVKDFLFFYKVFEKVRGQDQADRFDLAYITLYRLKEKFRDNPKDIEVIFNDKDFLDIFKDIKEELGRINEIKSDKFLEQMKNYFNIKDNLENITEE